MTIKDYYDIIISKYNTGDYKIKVAKNQDIKPDIKEKEFPIHALNYLIYEYMKDNKDNRWKLLLDYILVPNDVNQVGCDINFKNVEFEEFFGFMVSVKS
jgi:hypothetical protein